MMTDAFAGNPIREMFDRICGRYDLLNRVLSFGADPYWRWRAVRALAPRKGESVLDLCCGTGDLSKAMAAAVGPTGRVVGVDFAAQMLGIARAKCPQLTFLQGDACAVPLDEKFDHACLAFGPRNIPDLDKLWKEMQRLVRPGGRVLSLELTRPKGLLGLFHRFYLTVVVPLVGNLLSGDRQAYQYLQRTIKGFLDAQALAETMRAAGLRDVRIIPLMGGIATLHVATVP